MLSDGDRADMAAAQAEAAGMFDDPVREAQDEAAERWLAENGDDGAAEPRGLAGANQGAMSNLSRRSRASVPEAGARSDGGDPRVSPGEEDRSQAAVGHRITALCRFIDGVCVVHPPMDLPPAEQIAEWVRPLLVLTATNEDEGHGCHRITIIGFDRGWKP